MSGDGLDVDILIEAGFGLVPGGNVAYRLLGDNVSSRSPWVRCCLRLDVGGTTDAQ